VEAKRHQASLKRTIGIQLKSSRKKDAELIASQALLIEKLKQQNHSLLISHRALYDAMRESGTKESWRRFLAAALEVQEDLENMGAITNGDS